MSCGCGKKGNKSQYFMDQGHSEVPEPFTWGPIVWKYLHCLTEKIGLSNNPIVDNDQALFIENMITSLYLVIPCPECQSHALTYITSNPFPSLKGLRGEMLRNIVRNWLFNFHNHVRTFKKQPLVLATVEACKEHYKGCFVPKCEYTLFIKNVAFAVRQNWVKIDNWRKWYSNSEKLRISLGTVVI